MKSFLPLLLAAAPLAGLRAGPLTIGPDYHRPAAEVPGAYRDAAAPLAGQAAGAIAPVVTTDWWRAFGDPALDELEERALAANPGLQAAVARVEQARAAAGLARSAYWPQVAAGGAFAREQTSTTVANVAPVPLAETYRAPLTLSWELDLFGRVRRLGESARAEAAASAADFANVRLALTAEVASTHFALRAADRELVLVASGLDLRRRALDLVQSRARAGAGTEFDVARAETELAVTEAEHAALSVRRATLQDALAVLLGTAAPAFAVAPAPDAPPASPPTIPAGLPAALLERRPDVAAAEANLAAANARIGVAKAAFFPAVSLTGSAGYASAELDQLFRADSRLWAIGPSVHLPLFQGGRNRANLARSRAAYEENVALYRQRVLVAFREVQDALTATRLLAEQAAAQERAVAAARRAGELAQTRYASGYVNYFEVIDAQRALLGAERAATQAGTQRLLNSVALVRALGGGWSAAAAGPLVAAR